MRISRNISANYPRRFKDAILIGLAQALTIFPGVSRSGSTITARMALNLKRETTARLSFQLSAPISLGTGLKSAWDIFQQYHAGASFSSAELFLFSFRAHRGRRQRVLLHQIPAALSSE